MRLATYNLLHGRSLADGRVEASRLRDAVAELAADVVGLQEVDRGQPRSTFADQTADVAAAMAAPHARFAPAMIGTPGGVWEPADDMDVSGTDGAPSRDDPRPAYGVGLVSRLPVREWRTVRLRSAPVRSPVLLPGTRRPLLLQDEPRLGLAAVVETPFGPLTVATTHLSFVPVWNGVQLRWLRDGLAGLPRPVVLLGDLNMPGAVPRWLTGWRNLAALATYPVHEPRVQLDHVLASGSGLPPVRSVAALALPVSDHRALVVDLEDAAERPGTGSPRRGR